MTVQSGPHRRSHIVGGQAAVSRAQLGAFCASTPGCHSRIARQSTITSLCWPAIGRTSPSEADGISGYIRRPSRRNSGPPVPPGDLARRAGVSRQFVLEAERAGLPRPDSGRKTRRPLFRRRLAGWVRKLATLPNGGMSWPAIATWTRRRWLMGNENVYSGFSRGCLFALAANLAIVSIRFMAQCKDGGHLYADACSVSISFFPITTMGHPGRPSSSMLDLPCGERGGFQDAKPRACATPR